MSTDENKFRKVEWVGDEFRTTDDEEAPFPMRPPSNGIPVEDLELLTLAARAIDAQVEVVEGEDWLNLHFADGSIQYAWNPILISDDMLDLSLRLHLQIKPNGYDTLVCGDGNTWMGSVAEAHGDDPKSAARRAVTRAAAEIGKAMP
jgi:hypothetical protein